MHRILYVPSELIGKRDRTLHSPPSPCDVVVLWRRFCVMVLRLFFVEGDDSSTSPIATALRERRCERGLSIAEAAGVLRIRPHYVAAMEAGRFNELPGRIYAIGFVRNYARYLGLDGEQAVIRLKDELKCASMPGVPTVLSEPALRRRVAALKDFALLGKRRRIPTWRARSLQKWPSLDG